MGDGPSPDQDAEQAENTSNYDPQIEDDSTQASAEIKDPPKTPEKIIEALNTSSKWIRGTLGPGMEDEDIDSVADMARQNVTGILELPIIETDPQVKSAHQRYLANSELSPWLRASPEQIKVDSEKSETPEVTDPSELTNDQIPEYLRTYIAEYFPKFADKIYLGEWKTYDPQYDEVRGQILYFYLGDERTPDTPVISFVFRGDENEFNVNTFNMASIKDDPERGLNQDSVRAPGDNSWRLDQIDQALTKTTLRMIGVDTEDPHFTDQIFTWIDSGDSGKFITIQEAINEYVQLNIIDNVVGLVVERLKGMATYNIGGKEVPVDEAMLDEVRNGSKLGQRIIRREMVTLEAYRSLLADDNKLPEVSVDDFEELPKGEIVPYN